MRWAREGPMEKQERGARLARAGALQSNRNVRGLTWKDIFVGPNHHALWQQDDWAASEIRSEQTISQNLPETRRLCLPLVTSIFILTPASRYLPIHLRRVQKIRMRTVVTFQATDGNIRCRGQNEMQPT